MTGKKATIIINNNNLKQSCMHNTRGDVALTNILIAEKEVISIIVCMRFSYFEHFLPSRSYKKGSYKKECTSCYPTYTGAKPIGCSV